MIPLILRRSVRRANGRSLAGWLFGRPLATDEEGNEQVGALQGVPILGLDALSSAAYGPEAALTILLPLGLLGLRYIGPISLCIVGLLTLLFLSYRQTITAYPNGGGSFTVAKENLGAGAGLLAAAALSLDYMLNVAVAISAGVGALVSAVPWLLPYTLEICLFVLALLALVNLRGVRESGVALLVPAYLFVATLFFVLGLGIVRALASGGAPHPVVAPHAPERPLETASAWLLLRAFASGCTAMTGVEAVSNGVPIFRRPSSKHARECLAIIVGILVLLLLGVAYLGRAYGVTATEPNTPGYQSILSQLTLAVVGRGPLYYVTMASVVTVLMLSANTSFAGFPRLCRLLSLDGYLPELFQQRGRRLAYTTGISVLTLIAGVLLVAFGGVTDRLIPLFAVGALLAFTLSQAGMVVHWRKRRQEKGATRSLAVNLTGAVATCAALVVVLLAKFVEGAWISALLVLGMIVVFRAVHRELGALQDALHVPAPLDVQSEEPPVVLVPMRRWTRVAQEGLRLAMAISPDVTAVQVLTGNREEDDLTRLWPQLVHGPCARSDRPTPRLVVLRSEYRTLLGPLLDLVRQTVHAHPGRHVAVVVSELVERRWSDRFLHEHTGRLLKELLLLRGDSRVVILDVPWYWDPTGHSHRRRRGRPPPQVLTPPPG